MFGMTWKQNLSLIPPMGENSSIGTETTSTITENPAINTSVFDTDCPNISETLRAESCGDSHGHQRVINIIEAVMISGDTLIALLIFLSNSLVIFILYRKEILRNTTSTFMTSLALADLSIAIAMLQCTLVDGKAYTGHFATLIACGVCSITSASSVGISMYSLMAIAIERFVSIAYPYAYTFYITKTLAVMIVIIIWMVWFTSVTSFMVYYIHSSWVEGRYCWTASLIPMSAFNAFLCAPIISALLISIFIYGCIFYVAAKKARQIGIQESIAGVYASKRENKVTKMVALMFGAFSVCYLPTTLLIMIKGSSFSAMPIALVHPLWTIYLSNSFMNPVIFFWKSRKFRNALRAILGLKTSAVHPDDY